MASANDIVNTARACLSAMHAGSPRGDVVKDASNRLEAVKVGLRPAAAIQAADVLLSPLLNPASCMSPLAKNLLPEVHFGFHLLDEVILFAPLPWASFQDDVRAGVRHIAVTLFRQVSEADQNGNRLNQFPAMVSEKVVALLSGIALREWPQRWPDFIDELVKELPRAEMVCQVFRVMSEDIYQFRHAIANERRQQLTKALALSLPQALGFVRAAADRFYLGRNLEGLTFALATLEALLSWASLHAVFDVGIPQACFALLDDQDTRRSALLVLRALVNRDFTAAGNHSRNENDESTAQQTVNPEVKFRDIVFPGVLQFVEKSISWIGGLSLLPLSEAVLPSLRRAYESGRVPTEIDATEYDFVILFVTMLAELGEKNFCSTYLFSERTGIRSLSPEAHRCGTAFVDFMLRAIAIPSCTVRDACFRFFRSCLSAIQKSGEGRIEGEVCRLLVVGYVHASCLSMIQFSKEDDPIFARLEDLESVDGEDCEEGVHVELGLRWSLQLSSFAKLCPEIACVSVLQRLVKLLSDQVSDGVAERPLAGTNLGPVRVPRQLGFIVADGIEYGWNFGAVVRRYKSSWKSCFAMSIRSAEAVIAGAMRSDMEIRTNQRIRVLMEDAFNLMLGISDSELLPLKANALRMFTPLYSVDTRKLDTCFTALLTQGMNATGGSESRYTACVAISRMCSRLARGGFLGLSSYREPMCKNTVQIIERADYERSIKVSMLEASISTVLVGSDIGKQAELLNELFRPVLEKLLSSSVQAVLEDPEALFKFTCSESPENLRLICELYQLLEVGADEVVRHLKKAPSPIGTGSVMWASVAAKGIELTVSLIKALHGLYNQNAFPISGPNVARVGVLLPTCFEVTRLLNLGTRANRFRREFAHDLTQTEAEKQFGSVTEQFSHEALERIYAVPPDPKYSRQRVTLRCLRGSAYRIVGSCLYAGVTSPKGFSHLKVLLATIASDLDCMEPIHLRLLLDNVLVPLFSYHVVKFDAQYLDVVANSSVGRMLAVIRRQIELAKFEEDPDSNAGLLDEAREFGRRALARSAAFLIQQMFARPGKNDQGQAGQLPPYIPPAFRLVSSLREELLLLWITVCNPKPDIYDHGARITGFQACIKAIDRAPADSFIVFGPLLQRAFHTAIRNGPGRAGPIFTHAVNAVAGILRKWPSESESVLHAFLEANIEKGFIPKAIMVMAPENRAVEVPRVVEFLKELVTECIRIISKSETTQKNDKKAVRQLMEKVADETGASREDSGKVKVKDIPEKLVVLNQARSRRRAMDEDELELGDVLKDRLFGDGEPV